MIVLDHIGLLEAIATHLQPHCYLELGTFIGECIDRVKPHCGCVYGVDTIQQVNGLDGFFRMKTEEFFATVLPGIPKIDLAFIDADHQASSAFRDFKAVLAHANPGAVIALHDTFPESLEMTDPGFCGDSYKVPAMIHEAYPSLEIFTLPIPPGLTLVRNAAPGWCRISP